MSETRQLISLVDALVDDIQDGFAVNLVIPPGSVEAFVKDMIAGEGGKLPIQIQVDPTVDTADEGD